jgi:ZIP family zinc transporter
MAEAAFWGLVGGLALVAGGGFALVRGMSERAIAFVMAFGAGVLISAIAFDLTEEALDIGDPGATALGLFAGAFVYFAGNRILARRGGGEDTGGAIVLGALLDGIPESAAIGITLLGGGGVSLSFVVAVFLSNLPEAISATAELKRKHSAGWILRLWLGIAIASAIAAAVGYGALGDASDNLIAYVKAFAGGAILCMLADTFMPKAFREGGDKVGLVTVLGFALAALLSAA